MTTTTQCSVEGCDRDVYAKTLCPRHYQKARSDGTLPTPPPRPCQCCGEFFTPVHWDTRLCSSQCKEARRRDLQRRPDRTAQCPTCGTSFGTRRSRQIFCSATCRDQVKYKPVPKSPTECRHCGTVFSPFRSKQMYCSTACGQSARNDQVKQERLSSKTDRPPCIGCGGPMPLELKRSAKYCSFECKLSVRRHRTYDITIGELKQLLAANPVCQICKSDDWGKKGPCIDHCHETGRIRGVLCGNCNQGLGRFRDDPDVMRAAIAYLEADRS